MSESTSFWTPDHTASTFPSGEQMELLVQRGLEANRFSAQGVVLAQARDRERRQRFAQRRRYRGEEDALLAAAEGDKALQDADQQVKGVQDFIATLVRATGIPYLRDHPDHDQPHNDVGENNWQQQHHETGLGSSAAIADAGEEEEDISAPPRKHQRVEQGSSAECVANFTPVQQPCVENTSSSSKPMSALARLVAQAKAASGSAPAVVAPPFSQAALQASVTLKQTAPIPAFPEALKSSRTLMKNEKDDEDDGEEFGVNLSIAQVASSEKPASSTAAADEVAVKHPSQMTREEFLGQFKRAPRRGEIGQSAERIAAAEQLGYVMSGSRSRGAQMYVDRIQRQLHERDASKLQQQFRKVEDERMDESMIEGMLNLVKKKKDQHM